ncbi:MAG: 2-C-methyl-D-erythritol 2,4-cyclodiphosphate synthase [Kiritimatiellaeota bacterium]|nr:2-C-methyl-D-erythritol 2,4-cyclodiphosphate synthase [Kiritimatiellota bacterium]
MFRVGIGYDVHRLVSGRSLVLGGVHVPFSKGLLGHSDADVLTHAVIDAVLGAAGAGDIGRWFPDSDLRWRDARSLDLLASILRSPQLAGFCLGNLDSVIAAEAPRLASHLSGMRENLAAVFGVAPGRVSVKATTTEGLGCTGRGEGIAAQATVLLEGPGRTRGE